MIFWIGVVLMLTFPAFGLLVTGTDFFNAFSLLAVVGPALISGVMVGGPRRLGRAFAAISRKNQIVQGESTRLQRIFMVMGDVGLGSGILGTLIGALQLKLNFTSGHAEAIGAALAAALLSIIYGLAWKYYVCVPATGRIVELTKQEHD